MEITPEQQKIIDDYVNNGWGIADKLEASRIVVMEVTDVAPDGKETPLTAYIDPEGSNRIV